MSEIIKPAVKSDIVKPGGQMHRERVLRFLWYGAFPRLGIYIGSMYHAILNHISNSLNPTNISSQDKPEVGSEPGN